MTSAAFSDSGLENLHDVMAGHVERKAMPGLVALVARRGEVHVEVIGTNDFGDREPMRRDAIFRIASLTKPVVAAAAMTMVDDGTVSLESAVDAWLPELADRRVLRSPDADLDDTVPALRPITVEDVLSYRMGFGHVMAPPGTLPIQQAGDDLDLRLMGPPWPPCPHEPDEWMRRFGTLPLIFQPGERWTYGVSGQVLGVLLQRVAGEPLEAVLRERLFEPLGMHDTAFSVAPDRRARFTTAYAPDPETGELERLDGVDDSWWRELPAFPDASGGLVSTIDDYWAFVQMLLQRGEHAGTRVLSPSSVHLMTTDRLDAEQRAGGGIFLDGSGWGFGMAAPPADGGAAAAVPGGFGWDGGTGTSWRSNTDRDLTAILFTQRAMTSPEPPEAFTDFWDAAFAAIAG